MIRLLTCTIFILSLALSSVSSTAAEQDWQINLKNADINAFIGQVADITGKSFVIDPRVKGRVNVLSNEPLDKKGVYELFLSVLQVHGYAAVPAGDVTLVVQQNEVKQQGRDLSTQAQRDSQEMLTKVIIIKNTPALDLVPILRPLVARYGHLAGVRSVNALIISDHSSNISRIEQIIQKLDKTGNEELEVIQLKEAWVGDVVKMLQSLDPRNVSQGNSNNRGMTSGSLRVVADERSNRLIIKGEKNARKKVRVLIENLDQPSYFSGTTKVIRLQYADAKKLAKMLSGLNSETPAAGKKNQAKAKTGIYADEELNALVIRAEPSMLREMEELVSSLDVPRAQVLIESAIVEIKGDIEDALGVQWASGDLNSPVGGTNFSPAGPSLTSVAKGIAAKDPTGILGSGLTLGGVKQNSNGNPEFAVLLQALEGNTNANLLSTPSIMTIDNQEAEIIVGQNVPFRTGSTASGNNSNPFVTIKRQDVGITLKVVPHIHEGKSIRLEVEAKQESVAKKLVQGSADIITDKRSLKTTVMAANESTVALGGLIKDNVTEIESKVPILGDIPLIGWLFRSQKTEKEKSNMVVFLRPTIIRNKDDSSKIARAKFNGIWDFTLSGELLPENVDTKINKLYQGFPVGR